MKRSASLWAPILAAVILTQPGVSSAVPNTFMAGDPIDADEMNANFTDLEQRMAAIEDGDNQIVPVDCTADPNAFLDPNPVLITDNTTYVLKGMCNGPIQIFRVRNVIFEGDPAGVPKDDGIVLPPGLTENPFAAVGIWESNAELRNLTIDALAYVTDSYPFNYSMRNLDVGQHSMVRIYDVDFEGGDFGISVYRQSYAKIYQNVRVRNFNLYGVEAWGNAHVELANAIVVEGAATSTTDYPVALTAGSGGFLQIKGGGDFTPAGSGAKPDNVAAEAYGDGVIDIRNSGTTNLNGDIIVARNSTFQIRGGTNISGYIGAYNGSEMLLYGFTQTGGGVIEAIRASVIRIRDGSTFDGEVRTEQSSSIEIRDSTHTGLSVNAGDASSLRISNSTFAGEAWVSGTSTMRVYGSTRTGNNEVHVNENSSVQLDNTPIDATSIYVNASSTLRLYNGSNHSGGGIDANAGSAVDISDGEFSGNINANDNSTVHISNGTQIGGGDIGAGGGGIAVINGTSISSVSTNNGEIYFFGNTTESMGSANAFNSGKLFIHDATVNGTISTSAGGYLHMNAVTQSFGTIDLYSNATADIFNSSSVGAVNANQGVVLNINDGSVAGITFSQSSIASVDGAIVTGDIFLNGPSSNLRISVGSGAGTLSGNTIYLCGNTISFVETALALTGTVSNACGP